MRKIIYMAITLVSAISITGCSRPITENELAAIQETEDTDLHSASGPQDITQREINEKKIALDTTAADTASVQEASAQEASTQDSSEQDPSEQEASIQEPSTQESSDLSNAPVETMIELEGNKETVRMALNESSLGYQMSYDIDRFTVSSENGFDYYRTENSDSNKYPDIYIKIGRINKESDTDYVSQMKEALLLENSNYKENTDEKLSEYNTTQFTLVTGKGWNSITKNIYLLETDTSYYSIETQCFQEALEGYGARIEAILGTFSVD